MAKRKLNVAVIGYDFMGRAHSNAWRQVARFFADAPFEPVLKVLVGRTEAKVAEARERLGFAEHATSWHSVLSRADIDVVDICTPGDSHAEIAIAAAEAGKAILCEKPLANTLADAEPPRPNFEDGVQNQRVLDAISRSASSRRWEKVSAP